MSSSPVTGTWACCLRSVPAGPAGVQRESACFKAISPFACQLRWVNVVTPVLLRGHLSQVGRRCSRSQGCRVRPEQRKFYATDRWL